MKILKYAFILLFALSLGSCHKDDVNVTEGEVTTTSPEVLTAVTGDVLGYVYDEDNSPIGGATIAMLGKTTMTDQYGVYKFKNVELDQQGTYVKATKNGFMLGSDMIFGLDGVKHTSRIKMLKLDVSGTVAATEGGSVDIKGGGTITFSPNSIIDADGNSFSGNVNVTAKRIATDDPTIGDMMPGGLIANAEDGSTVVLGSMGMVAVELRDAQGNELNIAASKTARVTFPIADNQQAGAPETIKLWSFDEVLGRWEEDGVATKEGNVYVGELSHFSFWNCDAPFPLVNICGKVLYDDGTPANQVQISITAGVYGTAYGYTNADGSFGGKVPAGMVLTVKVYNAPCQGNEALYTIEVGPLENKTILDDIILGIPSSFSFDGQVLCSGDPVPNATVIYSYNNNTFVIESGDDGSFQIAASDACGDIASISVFAVDPETGNASSTVLVDPNTDPTLELQVCNDCGFEIEILTDDSVDKCEQRQLKVNVDGTGTYSYNWSNGNTDSSVNASQESGTFCVTVTDTDLGCENVQCTNLSGWFSPLTAEHWASASCDGEQGTIQVFPFGGYPPYEYTFSDPSLVNNGSDSIAVISAPVGTYGITITDSESCAYEFEVEVEAASGISIVLEALDDCFQSMVTATVTGGTEPYFYSWSNGSNQGSVAYFSTSGNYCVTVTDEFGCSATECIDVEVVDPFIDVLLDVSSCSEGSYTLVNNSITNVIIELFYEGQSYSLDLGQEVTIDFIPGEFALSNWILVNDPTGNCVTEVQFNLPILEVTPNNTLSYSVTERSCDTCIDGGIQLTEEYLNYNGWFGADADKIYVINSDYVDVTADAEANLLPAGVYYVVIDDENTGCYIYSDLVIIE